MGQPHASTMMSAVLNALVSACANGKKSVLLEADTEACSGLRSSIGGRPDWSERGSKDT